MSRGAAPRTGPARTGSWSMRLSSEIRPTYDAIIDHPFVTGLIDGSPPDTAFAHYVAQDVDCLRAYARRLRDHRALRTDVLRRRVPPRTLAAVRRLRAGRTVG